MPLLSEDVSAPTLLTGPLRWVVYSLGHIFVVLGLAGLVLPVVPTAPFLVVAAACYLRTSPRFHGWLMNHPIFGPPLRDWTKHRSLPLRTKLVGAASIAAAGTLSLVFLVPEGVTRYVSVGIISLMVLGLLLIPTRAAP